MRDACGDILKGAFGVDTLAGFIIPPGEKPGVVSSGTLPLDPSFDMIVKNNFVGFLPQQWP